MSCPNGSRQRLLVCGILTSSNSPTSREESGGWSAMQCQRPTLGIVVR
jgi:hypothetical protein